LLLSGQSIDVEFAYGCPISNIDESGFAEAIELARSSDIVFFFGGLDQTIEHEALDRTSIALPEIQLSLLLQIGAVVRSPLHVVMMSGSSLDLSYIRDTPEFGSLIWMGYAGQTGGYALGTVIFGQYNPAGRLPITFYPTSYVDAVNMTDMQMRPSPTNPGRTYKFYTGQAAYEFGTGLSYTTFAYSWSNNSLISSYEIQSLMKGNYKENQVLVHQFRVNVTNTGTMEGDDVVLAFITPPQTPINGQTPPIKQLCGFKRVHLNINETVEVFISVNAQSLLTIARDGSKWLHPGQYHIVIGKQRMHTIELRGKSTPWPSFNLRFENPNGKTQSSGEK
jgi:beta-D-xylosidase 4